EEVKVYREKGTGTNYNRPEWERLWTAIKAGQVTRLIVWRLDRLGRTTGPTIELLDTLEKIGGAFLSLRDGFDPSTPAGRLTRNVLASVAQFETEVRKERQMAGIEAARKENGGSCPWGGRPEGPNKSTAEKIPTIKSLLAEGKSIAEVSRITSLT